MTINVRNSLKACVLALFFTATLSTAHTQILTGSVGTGDDISYLVIQATDFGPDPLVYAFHYTYDPDNLLDSYDLFTAVVGGEPLLDAAFLNFGTALEPSYFLTSVTYKTDTLVSTMWPVVGPFWGQWVSGGEGGYLTTGPIDSGRWSFGAGMSAPYRTLAPGSWDGYVYSEDDSISPGIAPVPEPTALVLLAMGGMAILLRRQLRTA